MSEQEDLRYIDRRERHFLNVQCCDVQYDDRLEGSEDHIEGTECGASCGEREGVVYNAEKCRGLG